MLQGMHGVFRTFGEEIEFFWHVVYRGTARLSARDVCPCCFLLLFTVAVALRCTDITRGGASSFEAHMHMHTYVGGVLTNTPSHQGRAGRPPQFCRILVVAGHLCCRWCFCRFCL